MKSTAIPLLLLFLAGLSQAAPDTPATQPALPKRVVIALDNGGAMMATFNSAKTRAARIIKDLEPSQSFSLLVCTSKGVVAFRDRPIASSPKVQKQAMDFLDNLLPRGTPVIEDVLAASFKLKPDAMYLFCDANRKPDHGKAYTFQKNVPVHITAFSAESGISQALQDLAKASGGDCVDEMGKPIAP